MDKRNYIFYIIYPLICMAFGWLLVMTLSGNEAKSVFDPDVELKIPG